MSDFETMANLTTPTASPAPGIIACRYAFRPRDLERFLTDTIKSVDGIEGTETLITQSSAKETSKIRPPAEPNAGDAGRLAWPADLRRDADGQFRAAACRIPARQPCARRVLCAIAMGWPNP